MNDNYKELFKLIPEKEKIMRNAVANASSFVITHNAVLPYISGHYLTICISKWNSVSNGDIFFIEAKQETAKIYCRMSPDGTFKQKTDDITYHDWDRMGYKTAEEAFSFYKTVRAKQVFFNILNNLPKQNV